MKEKDLGPLADLPFVRKEGDRLIIDHDLIAPLETLIREEFRPIKVRRHEDAYLHILQPMEEAIVTAYRRQRTLKNDDVRRALKEIIDRFPKPPTDALGRTVYDRIHLTAALNAGKLSDMEIIACLNRLLDSIKRHAGMQGYLSFLDGMMP
jgi:hypothetical protein